MARLDSSAAERLKQADRGGDAAPGSVHRAVYFPFVATSVAGLAGVMLAAQLDSAPSGSLGVGFELTRTTSID